MPLLPLAILPRDPKSEKEKLLLLKPVGRGCPSPIIPLSHATQNSCHLMAACDLALRRRAAVL